MSKLTGEIDKLEKDLELAKELNKSAREKGKKEALYFLNTKTKGFTDTTAAILMHNGMSPDVAYTTVDQIWDHIKQMSKDVI